MSLCPRCASPVREVERASDDTFVIFRCFAACHQFRVGEPPPPVKPESVPHDPMNSAIKQYRAGQDCVGGCGRVRRKKSTTCGYCGDARAEWSPEEDAMVVDPCRPVDGVLAKKLNRSRKSIRMRRYTLRQKMGLVDADRTWKARA